MYVNSLEAVQVNASVATSKTPRPFQIPKEMFCCCWSDNIVFLYGIGRLNALMDLGMTRRIVQDRWHLGNLNLSRHEATLAYHAPILQNY